MGLPSRVLITGIHGHIGRALAIDLMQKGCEVSGIDRFEAGTFYQPYIAGDIPYMPAVFMSEMMDKEGLLYILPSDQAPLYSTPGGMCACRRVLYRTCWHILQQHLQHLYPFGCSKGVR